MDINDLIEWVITHDNDFIEWIKTHNEDGSLRGTNPPLEKEEKEK